MSKINNDIRSMIRNHARIAAAAAEIASARKAIRAINISGCSLAKAGLKQEAIDAFFASLQAVEAAIDAAAISADRNAADAQDDVIDLVAQAFGE